MKINKCPYCGWPTSTMRKETIACWHDHKIRYIQQCNHCRARTLGSRFKHRAKVQWNRGKVIFTTAKEWRYGIYC